MWDDDLRRLIRECGHTQASFAAASGVTPQYVNDLTHGRRDAVSLDTARRMAATLDISLSKLDAPIRLVLGTRQLIDERIIEADPATARTPTGAEDSDAS